LVATGFRAGAATVRRTATGGAARRTGFATLAFAFGLILTIRRVFLAWGRGVGRALALTFDLDRTGAVGRLAGRAFATGFRRDGFTGRRAATRRAAGRLLERALGRAGRRVVLETRAAAFFLAIELLLAGVLTACGK
jgi:hypothetical protein